MTRFVTSVVLIALLSGAVAASDPGAGRAMRQFKPRSHERQTGVREDDFIGLVGAVPAQPPVRERWVEWFVCPAARVIRLIDVWWSHPPVVVAER